MHCILQLTGTQIVHVILAYCLMALEDRTSNERGREHEDKIEAILNDAQKKQWKKMLGKPFALDD
jgi:hypothetical protein